MHDLETWIILFFRSTAKSGTVTKMVIFGGALGGLCCALGQEGW